MVDLIELFLWSNASNVPQPSHTLQTTSLDAVLYCRELVRLQNGNQLCALLDVPENSALVAFSDLHGNFENLNAHVELLLDIYPDAKFVFVGDAIDSWYVGTVSSRQDPDGIALSTTHLSGLPVDHLCEVASWPMNDCLLATENGEGWGPFSVGALRRAIIGALRSLFTVSSLMSEPRIFYCLGNHEVDLIGGSWAFRSLQKSFLLNLLGYSGLYCLEHRDWHKAHQPVLFPGTIHELRDRLKTQTLADIERLPRMLSFLLHSPVMLRANNLLFLHGGPCVQLNSLCREAQNIGTLNESMMCKYSQAGFNSPFFSELHAPHDTLLAPKFDQNHFLSSPDRTVPLLACVQAETLVVGHTPLLGTSASAFAPEHSRIRRVSDDVIKIDSGLKYRVDVSRHYLVSQFNKHHGLELSDAQSGPISYAV